VNRKLTYIIIFLAGLFVLVFGIVVFSIAGSFSGLTDLGIFLTFLMIGGPLVLFVGLLIKYPRKARLPPEARRLTDTARVEKLKQLLRVSRRVKIDDMAVMLGVTRNDLLFKLGDWAEQFGFTLDGEFVAFEDVQVDAFITSLEDEFRQWTAQGKV